MTITSFNLFRAWGSVFAALLTVSSQAQGTFQKVVVPNAFANAPGNSGQSLGAISFQQIFAGSQFSVSAGKMIALHSMAFRVDERFPAQSAVIPRISIVLSTSSRSMDDLVANPSLNRDG